MWEKLQPVLISGPIVAVVITAIITAITSRIGLTRRAMLTEYHKKRLELASTIASTSTIHSPVSSEAVRLAAEEELSSALRFLEETRKSSSEQGGVDWRNILVVHPNGKFEWLLAVVFYLYGVVFVFLALQLLWLLLTRDVIAAFAPTEVNEHLLRLRSNLLSHVANVTSALFMSLGARYWGLRREKKRGAQVTAV